MSDKINGFLIGAHIPELGGRVSNESMKSLNGDLRHHKPR